MSMTENHKKLERSREKRVSGIAPHPPFAPAGNAGVAG